MRNHRMLTIFLVVFVDLLGFSLISTFAGKNPAAKEKADQLRAKLVPYQIPLGFVCIGVGILSIVV